MAAISSNIAIAAVSWRVEMAIGAAKAGEAASALCRRAETAQRNEDIADGVANVEGENGGENIS